MKGQSEHNPEKFVQSNGKTQVNYNIVSEVITDEHGTRTIWKYDIVEVEGAVTKAKVMEAMQKADVKSDISEIIPDNIAAQYNDMKNERMLSVITKMTYAQADIYIDKNVTDLASARAYLKKLTRVVLAMSKSDY